MSIYRNGSGYYDPTAGEAIKEMEKSMKNRGEYEDGDIVEVIRNSGTQYEMVLLKCHKEYATALMLTESEPAENAVNILSMTPMYTDAGKVQYIYYKNICRFVRATSDSEYEALKEAVRRALNLGGGGAPVERTRRGDQTERRDYKSSHSGERGSIRETDQSRSAA